MTRRSADWNERLAKQLQDPSVAQRYIQDSLKQGLPLQEVLGKVVRAYGVKEFAAKVAFPSSNLLRVVNPSHNPTLETMNKLLKPFALRLTVTPTEKGKSAARAIKKKRKA